MVDTSVARARRAGGVRSISAAVAAPLSAASSRLALIVGAAACGAAAITGTIVLAHSRTKTRPAAPSQRHHDVDKPAAAPTMGE
jgi:hypothetical protein